MSQLFVENRTHFNEVREGHPDWNEERLEKYHQDNFCDWVTDHVSYSNNILLLSVLI